MSVVTMSQTVGKYTSGSTYRLRAREAIVILNAGQATVAKKDKANIIVGK